MSRSRFRIALKTLVIKAFHPSPSILQEFRQTFPKLHIPFTIKVLGVAKYLHENILIFGMILNKGSYFQDTIS